MTKSVPPAEVAPEEVTKVYRAMTDSIAESALDEALEKVKASTAKAVESSRRNSGQMPAVKPPLKEKP